MSPDHPQGMTLRAPIEVVRDGAVARVWLDRPESHNALSVDLGALPENFDPCNDTFLVLARGRSGDEAMVKFVARQCPPKD